MGTITQILQKQKQFFESGRTKSAEFRMEMLRKLYSAVKDNEQQILEAVKLDLNKSQVEAFTIEVGSVLSEISFAMKNLRRWMKDRKVTTPVTHFGASSRIIAEPFGVALIIAPWNYPFNLALSPLIGAIAAGNCAVVKPSELTPNSSALMVKMFENVFPAEYISIVEGGPETSQELLAEPFDYIFFTGGTAIGKIVMEAAAKHLTPVTLELGGKSPCIVNEDADIKLTAKRIVYGKFLNAGQTCIAPDYLLVHASVKSKLIEAMKEAIAQIYGSPYDRNDNYSRIVNRRHFERLKSYLEAGKIVHGGRSIEEQLMIEPTFVEGVTWEDPIMQNEIFGPLLPILEYTDLNDAIQIINSQPKPLALYVFTESKDVEREVMARTSSGGVCINDTLMHVGTPYLPFGGVGPSGTGSYHGKGSFDTFTHYKSVLKQTTKFDLPIRYPNYKYAMQLLRGFLK